MVLSLGKIACEISCCSSPKLSTQQYLNSYFFLFSFIVFCFFPPSDYHCGYLRMDITEEEMGKGLTRGREKNLREQKSSKTKTWDTVQNSLIINLESLKRVGNKKRAIKKKTLMMSLPSMWRLSNPLKARMITGLSLPLFFIGARESVLCRQQALRDREWRASSLQQMTSPCGLSAGFERSLWCWAVYWACLIKYEKYFLRVWPGIGQTEWKLPTILNPGAGRPLSCQAVLTQ